MSQAQSVEVSIPNHQVLSVGEDIKIKLRILGTNRVRVVILAPKNMRVARGELLETKKECIL